MRVFVDFFAEGVVSDREADGRSDKLREVYLSGNHRIVVLVRCQLESVPRYDISDSDANFRCVYSTLGCDGDGNLRILVGHGEWRVDGEKSI